MSDDFIALYNHKDAALVAEICKAAERHGLKGWFDDWELLGGDIWQDSVGQALKGTTAVLMFFGPNGPGNAQIKEELAHVRAVMTDDTRIIPVRINGGEVPKLMGVFERRPVDFPNGPDDPHNLDELCRAITRTRRKRDGEYSIHIAVPPHDSIKRTCFLAVGERTDGKLQDLLIQAVQETARVDVVHCAGANVPGLQSARYVPEAQRAIRAASFVLADSSVLQPGGAPESAVAYLLGIANALGKPCVLVTNEPSEKVTFRTQIKSSVVHYEPDEVGGAGPNYKSPLIDRLTKAISTLLDKQRHPYLVDADTDVDIAFADVFHLRVSFWKRFRQILHFGLEIDAAFQLAFSASESVRRRAEPAYMEMTAAPLAKSPQLWRAGPSWHLFREEYDWFQEGFEQCVRRLKDLESSRGSASAAFQFLVDTTTGQPHELIATSRDFFNRLNSESECFQEAFAVLKDLVQKLRATTAEGGPAPDLNKQVTYVKAQAIALPAQIRGVREHCRQMIMGLLELIETGGEPAWQNSFKPQLTSTSSN